MPKGAFHTEQCSGAQHGLFSIHGRRMITQKNKQKYKIISKMVRDSELLMKSAYTEYATDNCHLDYVTKTTL